MSSPATMHTASAERVQFRRGRAAERPPAHAVRSSLGPPVAAALVAIVGLGAGRVFAAHPPMLLALLAIAPGALAVLRRVPGEVRAVGHLAGAAIGLGIVAMVSDGRLVALARPWRGLGDLMSVAWPAPLDGSSLVFVGGLIAAAAAVAAELAASTRWPALALVPSLGLGVALGAIAAPSGRPPVGAVLAWVLGAVVLLAVTGPRAQTGSRRLVGCAAAAVVVTGVVTVFYDPATPGRFDPRRQRAVAEEQLEGFASLAAVAARRQLDPAVDDLRIGGVRAVGERWRLFAFDAYDGLDWTVRAGLRRAGRRLQPTDAPPVEVATVEVLGEPLRWVPTLGSVSAVDVTVATDNDRSMFLIVPAAEPGEVLAVSIISAPEPSGSPRRVAMNPNDPAGAFTADAAALAGGRRIDSASPELAEALDAIAAALRAGYRLDPDSPVATNVGALRAVIATSRQGAEEEFVAGFALIARAMGLASRVAVGYVDIDGDGVLTSAEVRAWPEVRFAGGWVPFDPVPTTIADDKPDVAQPLGEGAPAPLPDPGPVAVTLDPLAGNVPTPRLSGEAPMSSRALWSMLGLVLVVLVAAVVAMPAATIVAKRRRRRRRLRSARRSSRIIGAWAEATDQFVDFGARFGRGQPNVAIAAAAASVVTLDRADAVDQLARLANEAAHRADEADDLMVALAARLLAQVEEGLTGHHGRAARLRARCSLQSFRQASRSPVN